MKYDYLTSVEQPNQLTATYESVLFQEVHARPAEASNLQDDLHLQCNPAYIGASETTDQN